MCTSFFKCRFWIWYVYLKMFLNITNFNFKIFFVFNIYGSSPESIQSSCYALLFSTKSTKSIQSFQSNTFSLWKMDAIDTLPKHQFCQQHVQQPNFNLNFSWPKREQNYQKTTDALFKAIHKLTPSLLSARSFHLVISQCYQINF